MGTNPNTLTHIDINIIFTLTVFRTLLYLRHLWVERFLHCLCAVEINFFLVIKHGTWTHYISNALCVFLKICVVWLCLWCTCDIVLKRTVLITISVVSWHIIVHDFGRVYHNLSILAPHYVNEKFLLHPVEFFSLNYSTTWNRTGLKKDVFRFLHWGCHS